MSFGRNHHRPKYHGHRWANRPSSSQISSNRKNDYNKNYSNSREPVNLSQNAGSNNYVHPNGASSSSSKRRKFSALTWGEGSSKEDLPPHNYSAQPNYNEPPPPVERLTADNFSSTSGKRDRSKWEEDQVVFVSRDEIDKCSPSRKHGIDALRETYLRYSYCAFIQNAGFRLELPQATIGTAMVLCHRFFLRRSHAHHDRFLIATAALFLAAKSEESARPLEYVLRITFEIFYQQDFASLAYMLPVGWFHQYRESTLQAEHLLLTTLNFELTVEHPYGPLTTALHKLGLSHTALVNMALNLINEGHQVNEH